jgi:BASS family bile acid:Na+ symporter
MKELLKNWTLPVAMLTGTLLYLLFAFTPALSGAAEVMEPFFDTILPWFMFLILLVTFCKVDYHKLRPVGWHLWVGLFQVLFIAIVVVLILGFGMKGERLILAEAMLCCIIGPGAAAAPVVTVKLGGNLESMTTYTFISNFITATLVPVVFPLIDTDIHMSFLSSFLLILYKVCLILVLPMLLAYIVKHRMHRLHSWIIGIKDLSYYLWAISLAIVTGTTVRNIVNAETSVAFLLLIALLGLVLCVIQFAVGRYIGHFFNAVVNAGQALGQKNTTFAIWISYMYLNPLSSVGPGCYILWQNIVNSVELWQHRKSEEAAKEIKSEERIQH